MSDKNICALSNLHSSEPQAWKCAKKIEKENKIPMFVTRFKERGGEPQYLVHEILGCQENAVYDHYIGDNEYWAKSCAEALTRITGQHHVAQRIQKRFLFADVWDIW